MRVSAIFGALFLGLVSCAAVTYSDLEGVWTTGDQTTGCRTDIQFLYKNYVSYNTGEACDSESVGAFLGTYALADDVIFVQFCSAPDGFDLKFISYKISVDETGLSLYALDENLEKGALVLTATKSTLRTFDGVFSAVVAGTAATVRTQFDSGLYLSYTIGNEDLSGTLPYYGIIKTSQNDPDKFALHFADFAAGAIDGGQKPSDKVVYENVVVNVTSDDTLTLTLEDAPVPTSFQFARRALDVFEGLWTSFSESSECYTTVQFTNGLFRSYNIGGGNCVNQAFLGVYNVLNSDTIRVAYARSTITEFEKNAYTFSYNFGADDSFLELSGTIQPGTAPFFLNLTRVEAPPEAILTQLHLEGSPEEFDSDSFISELSKLTDLPTSQFEEVSVQNGSIIFNFAMIDDQAAEIFASDAFNTLAALDIIGGFNVIEISALAGLDTTVETPAPTAAPTGGPAGNAAASSFQIGSATFLFFAFVLITTLFA